MSCNLQKFCYIDNVQTFKNEFEHSEQRAGESNDDLWGEEWNSESESSSKEEILFPPNVLISLSPFADVLVIASETKTVFMTSKWETQEEKLKFRLACKIPHIDEKEKVTSIICLPLASQRRSLAMGPDWTCVVIGFSSGYIRVFTEKGEFLLSQCLYEEPVKKFRYQSPSSFEQSGDLIVIYPSMFVTLEGSVLLQTIKECRNRLAKVTAGYCDLSSVPVLPYKKWKLDGQQEITDCDIIGDVLQMEFAQLLSESVRDGPDTFPKTGVATFNLVVAAGHEPYFGIYHITEGAVPYVLSDVASAVASKIKTMLPTLRTPFNIFSKSEPEIVKEQPSLEPANTLYSRYVLLDKLRQGTSVTLSPNKQLAAITDTYGRVVLYDVSLGAVVRMWKGYRDAECGWIEAKEDPASRTKNPDEECKDCLSTSFLVIYAPKRGILEIWLAQQGPRVAVFDVGKYCRLLYSGHSAIGFNLNTNQLLLYPCCLLNPEGVVCAINAPFYSALREKNSKRIRDLHLLQTLKDCSTENVDETIKILLDMKTAAVREQAMEHLIMKDGMDAVMLANCVSALKGQLKSMAETEQLDYENKILIQTCSRILQLLSMYITLSHLNSEKPSVEMPSSPDPQWFSKILNIPQEEVSDVISVVSLNGQAKSKHVSFCFEIMTLSRFLGCFSVCERHLVKSEAPHLPISLKEGMKNLDLVQLGAFLFKSALEQNSALSILEDILGNSGINSADLLVLLLQYWLEKRRNIENWNFWKNFHHVVTLLFIVNQTKFSQPTNLWVMAHDILSKSEHVAAAYAATLIIRSVVIPENQTTDDGVDGEWETLTSEMTWTLLIKRLEDLMILTILLRSQQCPISFSLSVNSLLNGSQGQVSEVVAEWAVSVQLEPKEILKQLYSDDSSGFLCLLRKRFPRSLEPDAILANCCWEHMMQWKKNPDSIVHLTSALEYLRHICSSMLKNGVACMLWKTFVLNVFKALTLLMSKVGKVPKERQCKQELSLSCIYVEPFLEFCFKFLELNLDQLSSVSESAETIPLIPKDDLWKNLEYQGSPPLVVLAFNQKQADSRLINLHQMLANILLTVVSLQLKNVRPMNFYDSMDASFFFKDLNTPYEVSERSVSDTTMATRKKFLQRSVQAIVRSIPDSPPSQDDNQWSNSSHSSASKWINRIVELARGLDVNVDEIWQFYVTELYSNGLDSLAEEALGSVAGRIAIGFQLLHIAGQRIAHAMQVSGDLVSQLASLPPSVSLWLRCLEVNSLQCKRFSLNATRQLVGHAINNLPDEVGEYKIALSLLDVIGYW